MKFDVIIQARMKNTRLPGKVLKKINGKEILKIQYERILKSKLINKIIIATSLSKKDDIIKEFCKRNKILYFRGSETDVLKRYFDCAIIYNCKNIIRLTSDCPLIDPQIIDKVVLKFKKNKLDYCSNRNPLNKCTYPDGTDVEIFTFKSLKKAYENELDPNYREHVTLQFYKKSNYKSSTIKNNKDFSNYRFTLDNKEDFKVISFIINEIEKKQLFGYFEEIVEILKENSKIFKINKKYHKSPKLIYY